jgi:YggT family protein
MKSTALLRERWLELEEILFTNIYVWVNLRLGELLMTATIAINWGLGILLGLMTLLFIFRVVLTWTPQIDLTQMPFKLVAMPTEPLLVPLRKIVPPIGGVDMTPVILVGVFSLLRELLLGQQGILTIVASR